jgi:Fe-S-cluster containining protein
MKEKITRNTTEKKILELSSCPDRCGNCCVYGSGYILEQEISALAKNIRMDEQEFRNNCLEKSHYKKAKKIKTIKESRKPYGRCMFYDNEKKCTIHGFKPLHCRVGTCNIYGEEIGIWFMVNYLIDFDDPDEVRQYESFLKSHKTILGAEITKIVPKKTLDKIRKYEDKIKVKTYGRKDKHEHK